MVKDNNIFIDHILSAISDIEGYVTGKDEKSFGKDKMLQDAVIRKVEIIGEAARNLSEEFKSKKADVEWRDIMDMRNKLIHEYFGVDLETVWLVVKKDLPSLKEKLQK